MVSKIISETEQKMKKTVAATGNEFLGIRTGRASASLLHRVVVDYYGTKTPLNQLATITAPEPQLLVIQPWDKTVLQNIEKAILQSELGLTPSNDGNVIRLPFPPLNEERRRELVKVVRKITEEGRIAVRNIRREANEELKNLEKQHELSEDELRRSEDQIQKLTDNYIAEIDRMLENKEEEIMEV